VDDHRRHEPTRRRVRILRLLRDVQREYACEDDTPNGRTTADERADAERWAVTITFAPASRSAR